MTKRSLALVIVILVILAGGTGYYFWNKRGALNISSTSTGDEAVREESSSFFDAFFDTFRLSDETSNNSGQQGSKGSLKEYKDPAGIFSLKYPSSWVIRTAQGRRLTGVSITPQDLLNQYSPEEQAFVKGLIAAADESSDSPEKYFKDSLAGFETGQIETKNLAINGYPAYMVKGNINGVHYTIYTISHNNHMVYFNYRSKEEEKARQNDIQKSIDFNPYLADFEAAVNSIKFLK